MDVPTNTPVKNNRVSVGYGEGNTWAAAPPPKAEVDENQSTRDEYSPRWNEAHTDSAEPPGVRPQEGNGRVIKVILHAIHAIHLTHLWWCKCGATK